MKPNSLLIGISGGSSSGKTTIVQKLLAHFSTDATFISHDSYYKDNTHLSLQERELINYDHPDSLDTEMFIHHLQTLISGKPIDVPEYDYKQHNRSATKSRVSPSNIIVTEGILIFENEDIRNMLDVKVYVDVEPDIRLARKISRDMNQRNRTLDYIIKQYITQTKPMHDAFVQPSKHFADVIIPKGGDNIMAIEMLIHTIENKVKSRYGKSK